VLSGVGMKVLLVEGEEPLRRLANIALGSAGFFVKSDANGMSAVRKFAAAAGSDNVAIPGLSMTVHAGVELIRDLREIRVDVPGLRMTGDRAR